MLSSHIWLCATLWTIANQAPLFMGFSRQEYWSGLPCPSPGYLPDPGNECMASPASSALQSDSLLLSNPGSTISTFSSVQFHLSCVWLCMTPWIAACQASLSITNSQSLFKLMFIKSVMPSNPLILCHPLLLPAVPPSIRVFSIESTLRLR